MSMKISNNIIGNRTRDLPACSAVPQPTAPQSAPITTCKIHKLYVLPAQCISVTYGYHDKQLSFPPHITNWSVFSTKTECLLRGTK
jgi:hypothetical protein